MKANNDGKAYYIKKIKEQLKRLSFEQLKMLYQFIRGMIE